MTYFRRAFSLLLDQEKLNNLYTSLVLNNKSTANSYFTLVRLIQFCQVVFGKTCRGQVPKGARKRRRPPLPAHQIGGHYTQHYESTYPLSGQHYDQLLLEMCEMDEEEAFPVEILHYVTPHLIWVKTEVGDGKYTLEQIGLHGVVVRKLVSTDSGDPSSDWPDDTLKLMDLFFAQAVRVHFVPMLIDRRTSIFDNNIHKYGNIIIKTSRGKYKSLSKTLVKGKIARHDELTFQINFIEGKIKTKLSEEQTTRVIEKIKMTHNDIPQTEWEHKVSEMTSVHTQKMLVLEELYIRFKLQCTFKQEDVQNLIKNKRKDFEYMKGVDYEYIGRASRSSKASSSSNVPTKNPIMCKAKKEINAKIQEDTVDETFKLKKLGQFILEQRAIKHDALTNSENTDLDEQEVTKYTTDSETLKKAMNDEDLLNIDKVSGTDGKYSQELLDNYIGEETRRVEEKEKIWELEHGPISKKPMTEQVATMKPSYNKKVSKVTSVEASDKKETKAQYYAVLPAGLSVTDVIYKKLNTEKAKDIKKSEREKSAQELETSEEPNRLDFWHGEDSEFDVHIKKNLHPMDVGEDSFMDNFSTARNAKDNVNLNDIEEHLKAIRFVPKFNTVPQNEEIFKEYALKTKHNKVTKSESSSNDATPRKTEINENNGIKRTTSRALEFLKKMGLTQAKSLNLYNSNDAGSDSKITPNSSAHKQSDGHAEVNDCLDLEAFDEESFKEKVLKQDQSKSNLPKIKIPKSGERQMDRFRYIDASVSSSKFIENIITPKIMVHSKNNKCIRPTLELRDMHFSNHIHRILTQMGIKRPMNLQCVSWNTILSGHCYFMVHPRNSGKTMGYLPAVCRQVADEKEDNTNNGPICIIVCDTARAVVNVARKCAGFLSRNQILAGYAGVDVKKFMLHLLNGCDILVSTPCYLSHLLTLDDFSLDLTSLSIVVLDGTDRINDVYLDEFKLFYSKVKKMLKTRHIKYVQYVTAGTKWCNLIGQLSKALPSSVISIGSYHECVVYSNASTSVSFVLDGSKVDAVLEFLSNIDVKKRTVIVCTTNEEVKLLVDTLKAKHYVVFSADNDMSIELLYELNNRWSDYADPIIGPTLVCVDLNLSHLNLTNANYLVHYSLPDMFSRFCSRFACLLDHYKSMFNEIKYEIRIKILVDSNNVEELPKILNFMKRCTPNIPESLNDISEKVLKERDRKKLLSFYPICDDLLAFGKCQDFWYCKKRHTFFPDHDAPQEWLPKRGMIKFSILHYHTAAHYSALITSYTIDGETTYIPSTYGTLNSKLGMHFLSEKNRRLHGIPKLGDICAVAIRPNDFQRCQVIRVVRNYDDGNPHVLIVNLLEEEKEELVKDVELYHLPEEFKSVVSHVVQIRLANVQPKDRDIQFSDLAKEYLKSMLKDAKLYIRAKVLLTVGNTIIVEQVEACQDLKTLSQTVVSCNFNNVLCDAHCCPNEEHIPKLLEICKGCGIQLPKDDEGEISEKKYKESKKLHEPQWAHLESDVCPLVYFSSAENPELFFIRLVKFDQCINNLTKDIQKYIHDNEHIVESIFEKGEYVLAKFPDDSLYYRARVDDDNEEKHKCFFVDHGEWRNVLSIDIRPITEYFIKILPFQAIECRLIGLEPMGEEWSDWSINYFTDLCFESASDDTLKELYVKYFTKEKAELTNGYKYGVVMVDSSGIDNVLINDIMLNANMAGLRDAEKDILENFVFNKPKPEEEELKIEVIETDEEMAWEKEAEPYKDDIYIRKFTDDESFHSNDLDIQFTVDDFVKIQPQIGKELLALPSTESVSFKSIEEKSDSISTISTVNISENTNKVIDCANKVSRSIGSRFEIIENKTKADSPIEIVRSMCSSYEIIENKTILDSDDSTSPEGSIRVLAKTHIDLVETSKNNLHEKISSEPSLHNAHTNHIEIQRKPKLIWSQSKTTVTIKIEVTATEEYTIDFKPMNLSFQTFVHDTNYGFSIELHGGVIPNRCTHTLKGLYILIKLEKLLKTNWRSLCKDTDVKRWIVHDPDSLPYDYRDDDEDHDDVVDVQKKEFYDYIATRMHSDGDSESEDDDFNEDGSRKYN